MPLNQMPNLPMCSCIVLAFFVRCDLFVVINLVLLADGQRSVQNLLSKLRDEDEELLASEIPPHSHLLSPFQISHSLLFLPLILSALQQRSVIVLFLRSLSSFSSSSPPSSLNGRRRRHIDRMLD
mmetsp:Transcript_26679/g.45411  ORF Transcript_26679/g.45411 Transcript_26679/m.45411 type:complete len:125 (-) Transcript_26679:48-422(-)